MGGDVVKGGCFVPAILCVLYLLYLQIGLLYSFFTFPV